jgi:hypothetical protein
MKHSAKHRPEEVELDDDDAPILTPELLAKAKLVGPANPPGSKLVRVPSAPGETVYKVVRGGVRPGAGRKPSGHVRLSLSVSPRAKAALERRAKKEHKTLSAVIEELLVA